MMREKRNYVIVGGFTLIMLVALIVSVSLLTGHSGALESYQTRMTNVAGIKFGTKVSYEGFAIGQVEQIEPLRRHDGNRNKAAKELGAPITVEGFVRFQVGEGIEKAESDFADEVKQMAGH